ncbi:hypothetical protein CDD83_3943 [Cordyceps sp. RAO-2017]|nr:hypothetical protein CDD83_3943 [Cordyceps sp. RAO-2017]
MLLNTLVPLLLAASVLGNMPVDPEAVAKNFTDSLLAKTTLDWKQPPHFDQQVTEPTCANLIFQCLHATFRLRQTLLPSSKPKLSVDFDRVSQRRFLNLNNEQVVLSTDESVWTSEGSSNGWRVGAALSGKSISVSSDVSFSTHASTTRIQSLGITETCPGGHECHFETWVYHTNWAGNCRRSATIDCGGEMDVCRKVRRDPAVVSARTRGFMGIPSRETGKIYRPHDLDCPQLYDWSWRQCWASDGPRYGRRERACRVRAPIMEAGSGGRPLFTTVFVKEDHRSERPEAAVRMGAACIVQLQSGRWYDAEDDTFYDEASGGWLPRGGAVPLPAIAESLRRPNCSTATGSNNRAARRAVAGRRRAEVTVVAGFRGFGSGVTMA